MSKARTEAEKLRPSFEHNQDKVKAKIPKPGELWRNSRGTVFVVHSVANLVQLEPYTNHFPVTIVFYRQGFPKDLGARHLLAWQSVMHFIASEPLEHLKAESNYEL